MSRSLRTTIDSFEYKTSAIEAEISRHVVTITKSELQLKAKTKTLEEKDTIISRLNEQLTRVRERLSSKQLVSIE